MDQSLTPDAPPGCAMRGSPFGARRHQNGLVLARTLAAHARIERLDAMQVGFDVLARFECGSEAHASRSVVERGEEHPHVGPACDVQESRFVARAGAARALR